ncbi:Hypothetical predicted protein [Marmota monax]|uniref:Uncharacterized protein n=1 Tax=Marmota monax TaxID=9995 RepID=A0A5E4D9R4_MARMO|nr:Hypothetical predicted protein [Marmota monax]
MAQEAMDYDLQVQLDHATEQLAPTEVVSSQGRPPLLQPVPVEGVSNQERPPLLHPVPAEGVSSQERPSLLHPVPVEGVNSHGGPPLPQPAPAEGVSSQGVLPLLHPAPHMSIDLTEEVELSEDNVQNINPGASEEHRQGSGANHTLQAASLDSMNSFISGLQRLHGMLEFLRPPPSDQSVGPVRARRRRGSTSRRARASGSQRTDNARLRAPLDAYFQVSRTQPHFPAASYDSETRDPVPEDLPVSSSSDSDSESSAEYEEVVVPAEETEAVISEEQLGDVSADQEVNLSVETRPFPNSSLPRNPILLYLLLLRMKKKGILAQYVWNSGPMLATTGSQHYTVGTSLGIDAFLSGLKDKHENVTSATRKPSTMTSLSFMPEPSELWTPVNKSG